MVEESLEEPTGGGIDLPVGQIARAGFELWKALRPPPPDPVKQLQVMLLHHQLAKLMGRQVTATAAELPQLVPVERHELVISGSRGSGKTALGVIWAQIAAARRALAKADGQMGASDTGFSEEMAPRVIGWPSEIAREVGLVVEERPLTECRECVLLVDEAVLFAGVGKRRPALSECLALARHRDLTLVWTTQALGSINREVLRLGPMLAFKWVDPMGALFDREEAQDLLSTAISLQGMVPDPSSVRVVSAGRWAVSRHGLPEGWSDAISRVYA